MKRLGVPRFRLGHYEPSPYSTHYQRHLSRSVHDVSAEQAEVGGCFNGQVNTSGNHYWPRAVSFASEHLNGALLERLIQYM